MHAVVLYSGVGHCGSRTKRILWWTICFMLFITIYIPFFRPFAEAV